MPQAIGSPATTVVDPELYLSLPPEEPNICSAEPAPPPEFEPMPYRLPSSEQRLVVEYDQRGPSCARERTDALRDCSFAALGVVTTLVSSRSVLALGSLGSVARDVLRCTESTVRLEDCREQAELKQAAEQRCEDRGGQVIRGERQVLCFESR